MQRLVIAFLSLILLFACSAFGQKMYTPEKGSAERKAILDVLRVPVEKELKQKIVFTVEQLNVLGNWAFIGGAPQGVNGGSPDYSRTIYSGALDSGAFDNNFFALLKKTSGNWKVVTYIIGCTDVCYAEWWKQYRAPKTIFPYNY